FVDLRRRAGDPAVGRQTGRRFVGRGRADQVRHGQPAVGPGLPRPVSGEGPAGPGHGGPPPPRRRFAPTTLPGTGREMGMGPSPPRRRFAPTTLPGTGREMVWSCFNDSGP